MSRSGRKVGGGFSRRNQFLKAAIVGYSFSLFFSFFFFLCHDNYICLHVSFCFFFFVFLQLSSLVWELLQAAKHPRRLLNKTPGTFTNYNNDARTVLYSGKKSYSCYVTTVCTRRCRFLTFAPWKVNEDSWNTARSRVFLCPDPILPSKPPHVTDACQRQERRRERERERNDPPSLY